MLTTFLLWSLLLAALMIIIRWIHRKNEIRKLIDKIPGPPKALITGNLDVLMCSPKQLWHNVRTLSKEYYPIYRLWSGYHASVFLLTAEDIEILISTTKNMEKSRLYELLHPWLRTGLLTSAGDKWHVRRKLLTPAFHFNILLQFMGVFAEQSDVLVKQLKEECTKPFTNIVPYITRFTLHSICETSMGTKLDYTSNEQEMYRQAIYEMGEVLLYRLVRPWLYYNVIYYLTKAFRKQRKLAKTLHSFTLDVIRTRSNSQKSKEIRVDDEEFLGSVKRRLAMLDLLISARNSGAQIDEEDIREEVDTFMFEGHDTTTMAISFTLMLLAYHQDIQERIVQELKEVLGDTDEHPTYQQLHDLKYLEMVIKESLRLYPSVHFISRVTSEEMQTHTGYTIPAGVYVTVLIYDLHHNPKYYPDPDRFDPDRFLPENIQMRHPFSYLPFSAGPRNCIGQKFAILEIKTAIAKILMKLRLLPYDKPEDITFIMDIILRTEHGIRIKIRPRI